MLWRSDPITVNKKSEALSPNKVTMIDIIIAKTIDWATNSEAWLVFFAPSKFPILAFVAAPIPTPTAIITKYIGKDFAIAPIASAEIFPANQVSTKL